MTITLCNTEDEFYKVNKTYTTVTTYNNASIVYPCNILNPTFKIKGGYINANAVTDVFGRNYWIVEQTINEGINYITCRVDAFSSWKDKINGSTQFVTRSEKYGNRNINDTSFPCTSEPISQMKKGTLLTQNVSYVIGVI